MSESGATGNSSGSERNSAPGGTVISAAPANVSGRSLVGSMAGDEGESGRATCTDVKCSGSVPKAFERCTRRAGPPTDKWKICRTVASRRSSGGKAFCGSGICWEDPQLAIHTWSVAVGWARAESQMQFVRKPRIARNFRRSFHGRQFTRLRKAPQVNHSSRLKPAYHRELHVQRKFGKDGTGREVLWAWLGEEKWMVWTLGAEWARLRDSASKCDVRRRWTNRGN